MPLGQDPGTGKDVFLRDGPYGPYVQLGVISADEGDPKPVRAPVRLKGCGCFSISMIPCCQRGNRYRHVSNALPAALVTCSRIAVQMPVDRPPCWC